MEVITEPKVTIQVCPTTLAEVWVFAMQSGEFVNLPGYLQDAGNGRCAWGVLHTTLDRMGVEDQDERNRIVLGLADLADRTAVRLGYAMHGVQGASDVGCTLEVIGRAMQTELDSALMRDFV